MADETTVSGDAPVVDATAAPDTSTDIASVPDVDRDELAAAVQSAADEAGLRAEIANLRRAAGHIPGVQKRIDAVEKAVSRLDATEASVRSLSARLDTLLDAMPEGVISERALAQMRPVADDGSADLRAKIADLENRLTNPDKPDEPDLDPQVIAFRAQWQAATDSVEAYAKRVGYDFSSIGDATWQRAFDANRNDPTAGALAIIGYVDEQVAAEKRRGDKKDAMEGGAEDARTPRRGPLTLESMKKMSRAELMAIPYEERMAALRG
jgi:hypothetical protein